MYGDVLTNAQIEEGVEREIERVNVRYGLTHSFLRVSLQKKQTNIGQVSIIQIYTVGLKQYNLLYGNVLTNALIEEGVEIGNVHYGPLFRECPFKQTNKQTNKQI